MISVCIATYNGEKYIKEQLNSILTQIDKDDEIIISDDGSSDNTLEVLRQINDSRIKIFINNGLHGFTHNFENAIMNSNGDYIFLSDQDDVWYENKVERVMQKLSKCDLVIHDCTTVDYSFKKISDSRFKDFNIKPGFVRHIIKSRYIGCCMAFNREFKELVLPFPKLSKYVEHDIWIASVGFAYRRVELLNEPLIYYRRHGNNTSLGGFDKGYSTANKLMRRIYRLGCLSKLIKKARKGI